MQPRKFAILLVVSVSVLFLSCKGKSDKKETTTSDTTATNVINPADKTSTGTVLFCRSKGEDSLATPHSDVILSIDGTEKIIRSINSCSEISKSDYASFEIPADAITAIGGRWAGLGSYFYLIQKNGKYVVYEGWTDEGQEDKGYHWKEIRNN